MAIPAGPSPVDSPLPNESELFTLDELAVYMRQPLSDIGEDLAVLVRTSATGIVQTETAQHLLHVTSDVVTLCGGGLWIELPERPVISIADVSGYGVTGYERRGDRLRRPTSAGDINRSSLWPAEVTVTYSHGYRDDNVPGDLKGVALAVAARALLNPASHVQETAAGYSVSYAASGLQLTDSELRICRRYRRRTAP